MKKITLLILVLSALLLLDNRVYAQCSLGSFSVNSPSSVTTSSMTISWGSSTGAEEYQLQRRVAGSGSYSNVGSRTTSTSKSVTGLSAGTSYEFRVFSYCDYSFYDPEQGEVIPITNIEQSTNVRTGTTKPNAPTSRDAISTTASSFTARWYTATGATGYEIDVSTSSSFTSYLSGFNDKYVSGGSSTSVSVTGLTPGVRYYYRVRAKNSGGTSSNSSTKNEEALANTPVIGTGSDVTQNSFTANWSSASGAEDYRLFISTSNSFITHITGYGGAVVTSTNESVTGLTPGSAYYYRVKSANNDDQLSGYSGTRRVEIIPSTPSVNEATDVSSIGFTANWSDVSGEDNYRVDISSDSDFSTFIPGYEGASAASNSLIVSGLDAGDTYYFKVRSENEGGESPDSDTGSIQLLPGQPTNVEVSGITQTSVSVSWDNMFGTEGYLMDVSTEADFSSFVEGLKDVSVVTNSTSLSDLTSGETYFVRVQGQNGSGLSAESESGSFQLIPSEPTPATNDISQTSFAVNWTSQYGSDEYLLDISTSSDFSDFVEGFEQKVINSTSESITGLNPGSSYFWRVLARNNSGNSSYTGTQEVLLIPPNPADLSITNADQTSFTIGWSESNGADEYLLDLSFDPEFSEFVEGYESLSVGGTSLDINSLAPGETYYIRLKSVNASGESDYSDQVDQILIPKSPTNNGASEITQNGFTANWTEELGVASYSLDVSQSATFDSFIDGYEGKVITTGPEILTGLNAGEVYYYRVRSSNATGNSENSDSEEVLLIPTETNTPEVSNIAQLTFDLSWNVVTGAEDYMLDVATDEIFSSFVTGYEALEVSGVNETVTVPDAGSTYFVRLKARNSSGESSFSGSTEVLTIPGTPVADEPSEITETTVDVSWSAMNGATHYLVDLSEEEDFSGFVEGYHDLEVTGTNLAIEGLISGNSYFYRVRSQNSTGISDYSNVVEIAQLIPEAPELPEVSEIGTSSFALNWEKVKGAAEYLLDVAINATFTSIVSGYQGKVITDTSEMVTGLQAGDEYFVRLRAKNGVGTSEFSETATILMLTNAPDPSEATNISQVGFEFSWDDVFGADNYLLDIANSESFESFVEGYEGKSVTETTEIVSDLEAGNTYYYRLRAENQTGTSDYSDTVSVLLIPATPNAISISEITQTSFITTWNSSHGAASYRMDVALDAEFNEIVEGLENVSIENTQITVENLSEGTQYFVRVRAVNTTGTTGSSEVVSTQTIPADPRLAPFAEITQNSALVTWSEVAGVDEYLMDLATDANFESIVDDYENKIVSGNEHLTGLAEGTTYFARLSARNESGESFHSEVIETITIPANPAKPEISTVTQTGFHVQWESVNGAEDYLLDLATESTFTNIVNGIKDVVLTAAEFDASQLTSGDTYFVRVRARNASGISDISFTATTTLVPANPESALATSITQTEFTANWETTLGVDAYLFDVSQSADFSDFLEGFEALEVTGTSFNISELTPGEIYFYRVSGQNENGISGYSAIEEVLLAPGEPVFSGIENIETDEFEVLWDEVQGAEEYSLDISLDDDFDGFLDGYEGKLVSGASHVIDDLNPGKEYYLRLKAINQSGESGFSNVFKALTLPSMPGDLTFTEKEATSFTVSWPGVDGIEEVSEYDLYVAIDGTNFTEIVDGYGPRVITAPQSTRPVDGLQPSTLYEVKLIARNASGNSQERIGSVITSSLTGEVSTPEIDIVSESVESLQFKVVEGAAGSIESVLLFHKQISQESFNEPVEIELTQDNSFEIEIKDTWKDVFGWEYRIEAKDKAEMVSTSNVQFNDPGSANFSEIITSFSKNVKDYRMISIPFELKGNQIIRAILTDQLRGYDDTRWRFVRYEDGEDIDYTEGLEDRKFQRGMAYWFISAEPVELDLGQGKFTDEMLTSTTISLESGYNQIGCPFPAELKWTDILEVNGNPEGVSTELLEYNGAEPVGLKYTNFLKPFEGVLVYSENDVVLEIPAYLINGLPETAEKKVKNQHARTDENGWFVPITVNQGAIQSSFTGIGMNTSASIGFDKLDMRTPPRFAGYSYMATKRESGLLSRDVVDFQDDFTWDFKLLNNGSEDKVIISWHELNIPTGASLVLFNPESNEVVDMSETNEYSTDILNAKIQIHYSIDGFSFLPDTENLIFGSAYPNPFTDQVQIPFKVSFDELTMKGSFSIYNELGQMIYSQSLTTLDRGLNQISWNGTDNHGQHMPAGIYYFKLVTNINQSISETNGKILKH